MARRRYQKGQVYERDGLWYGRYYDSVLLPNGSERRIRRNEPLGKHPTEKMALRALEPILAKLNATSYHPMRQSTWAEFSEQWKQTMLQNYKPSVQPSVRSQLKVLAWFNKINLNELDNFQIQQFIAKSKCAPKTIKNHIALMRSMWRQARAWRYAQHNPFEDVVLPKIESEEQPAYSPEQVERIMLAAKPPYNIVIWVFAETGMRRGELCGLDVGDVDYQRLEISVRHSRWGKHLTSPKSRKPRRFDISDLLAEALREYTEGRQLTEPLFLSTEGCRLHPENLVKRVLKPILKQLGLPGACHAFRHGNITAMGRRGTSPAVMQQRVGHAAFTTTMGYMHVVSEDARETANALGRLYAPGHLASMKPKGGKQ